MLQFHCHLFVRVEKESVREFGRGEALLGHGREFLCGPSIRLSILCVYKYVYVVVATAVTTPNDEDARLYLTQYPDMGTLMTKISGLKVAQMTVADVVLL